MENLIKYTDNRIAQWYCDVKRDYGVIGSGKLRFENNYAIVDYIENGKKKVWSMPFFHYHFKQERRSWIFECWSELAK